MNDTVLLYSSFLDGHMADYHSDDSDDHLCMMRWAAVNRGRMMNLFMCQDSSNEFQLATNGIIIAVNYQPSLATVLFTLAISVIIVSFSEVTNLLSNNISE